jgi:two-component system, OmpR family, phosphate regulon response regulator PhoB
VNATSSPTKVLVVDDDGAVRSVLRRGLEAQGFVVDEAADGAEALERVPDSRPDVVLLDLMMPGPDGFDVLVQLHALGTPVIVITGQGELSDRVTGLDLGADDYVIKPVSPIEVAARVRSVLRRARGADDDDDGVIALDGLVIDPATREVHVDGAVVATTVKEFDLLLHLVRNPRRVLTREQLLVAVWDSSPAWQDPATVTEHIRRLRRKVERDPDDPRWIRTVRGVGYRFTP